MDTKTLIDRVSQLSDINMQDTSKLLDAFISLVGDRCAAMDSIAVPGFGSFETKKRLERVMIMPSSGRRMLMPPKLILSFKPSVMLKQRLREHK